MIWKIELFNLKCKIYDLCNNLNQLDNSTSKIQDPQDNKEESKSSNTFEDCTFAIPIDSRSQERKTQ